MKILVLCSDNPNPPINGTRIRNFHLWPEVKKLGHDVRILSITRNEKDLALNNKDIEFFMFTRKNILKRIWMRLFHCYHEWPVSDSMSSRVEELIKEWRPDVVHAEEFRMGHYLPENHNKDILFSVCAHNVESELIKKTMAAPFRFGTRLFNKIYQFNLVRFEKKVFQKADIRLTYSEIDKDKYEFLYPQFKFLSSSNGINIIPLSDDEKKLPPPQNILFLGSLNYLPNIEGLFWFLDNIYPKLKGRINFFVAGSTPAQIVKDRLKNEEVVLYDTPIDLKPVYLSTSLLLVPLLSGSGTRGKILESLMYQRPVLTTTIGVEGLHLNENEGILIADGQKDFLRTIEYWLAMNQADRQKISDAGRDAVLSRYTWKKVGEDLIKVWTKK